MGNRISDSFPKMATYPPLKRRGIYDTIYKMIHVTSDKRRRYGKDTRLVERNEKIS